MSEYRNEEGEWLMDGAAIRTEWALDAQSAEERFEDDFYSRDWEDNDNEECDVDNDATGGPWCYAHDERAEDCEAARALPDFGMEDQHLDGMYED